MFLMMMIVESVDELVLLLLIFNMILFMTLVIIITCILPIKNEQDYLCMNQYFCLRSEYPFTLHRIKVSFLSTSIQDKCISSASFEKFCFPHFLSHSPSDFPMAYRVTPSPCQVLLLCILQQIGFYREELTASHPTNFKFSFLLLLKVRELSLSCCLTHSFPKSFCGKVNVPNLAGI